MAIELFGYEDIKLWKRSSWLVEGCLQCGSTAFLAAPSKVGKTLFVMRLAAAVSTGSDFFGRKTQQGRVVYLYAERAESTLQDRLDALDRHGVEIADTSQLAFITEPIDFTNPDKLDELVETIGTCDLLIIDTLTSSAGATNIMEPHNMKTFAQNVKKAAKKLNSTALIVHHDHKQGFTAHGHAMPTNYSGPSELVNNTDSYIAMWKSKQGIQVETRSSNGGEDFKLLGQIVSVRTRPDWVDGVFEELIPEPVDEEVEIEKKVKKKVDKQRALIRAFMLGKEALTTEDMATFFDCTPQNVGRKLKPYILSEEVEKIEEKGQQNKYKWVVD